MRIESSKTDKFPVHLVKDWEAGDGVNFAVALSRLTGWLLQVDWWSPRNDNEGMETSMKSLRVYVQDNKHNIFDIRGKRGLTSFRKQIIEPILKQKGKTSGTIVTRYYGEEKFWKLPLRVMPDERRIQNAVTELQKHSWFMEKIPVRQPPLIPAHLAANYTYGHCAVYATATMQMRNLQATSMLALAYAPLWEGGKLGYVHSFNLHPDGMAEDCWGKQTIATIADRFGITNYELSESKHNEVDQTLKTNSPELYDKYYVQAEELIKSYCM